MKILDKYKDYYDFLSHTIDSDDTIFFDRRGSTLFYPISINIDDSMTEKDIIKFATYDMSFDRKCILGLYSGYSLFLFEVKTLPSEDENDPHRFQLENSDRYMTYSISYIGSRKNYERDIHEPILEFYSLTDNSPFNVRYKKGYKSPNFVTSNLKNAKVRRIWDTYETKEYSVPILKDTFIAKFIHPEDIYYSIEEFISSKKNDIDTESKGLTDKEKVINHGFDTKSSFRNVK